MSEEQIQKLKEILRLSPSSINGQPWNFIFVSNEKIKNQLAEVSYFNEQKIKEASHLVVFAVVDDLEIFEKQIKAHLPKGAVDYYNSIIKPQPENVIKSWFLNQVYLSLGFFLSGCASLGIDSTAMEGIEKDKYDEILNMKGYKTAFAVAIGFRHEEDSNHPSVKEKSRLEINQIISSI